MAVIREKRQFQIGPVGVARSSRAGQITGEAIARTGAQAQQFFAQRAAEEARKAGIEYAQGLERSEIIELDPQTGRPKIYEGPSGFGRIAQNAYQQVLLQRFETEIGNEIEDKSKELAIEFSKSPEGFREAMSEYIAQMSNVEESTVFKQVIQSVGTNVQNSKYRALQLQAQALQEKNDQLAYINSSTENISSIEDAFAVGNFELGNKTIESGVELDNINVQAKTILSNATLGNNLKRNEAKARGVLRYELYQATKSNVSDDDLNQALIAIDSGDLSRMPEGIFPQLTKILGGKGASFRESIAEFGTELITDGINQIRLDRQINLRNRQAEAILSQNDLTEQFFNIIDSSDSEASGALANSINNYINDREEATRLFKSGASEDEVNFATSQSSSELLNVTSALTRKMFNKTQTVEELINVQQYLKNPSDENAKKVSDELKGLADSLIEASIKTNQPVILQEADKYAESISDEKNYLEEKKFQEASIAYNNYLTEELFPNFSTAKTIDDINNVWSERWSEGYKSLNPVVQERYKSKIRNFVSGQFMRIAFSSSANPKITMQMEQYARDPNASTNLLTEDQIKAIDQARANSDDPSTYTTYLNEYSARADQRYNSEISNIQDRKLFNDILNNARNTSDLNNSERQKIDRQLGIPSDFYTNPQYSEDARLSSIVEQISPSYWPQAQYDTINSFLAGRITDEGEIKRVLTTYAKARSYVTDNGFTKDSGGLSGLDSDKIALMNAAVSFAETNSDPQAMMQHLQQINRSMSDPNLSEDMDAFFTRKANDKKNLIRTENVEDYIAANFKESLTNPNLFARLVSAAKIHYFESISETRDDKRFDQVDEVLQKIIDNQFVEDERIITSSGSNKSLYPLSETVKDYEDAFISYIRSSMKNMSADKNIDWNTVDFKLMPVGFNSEDRGMTYGVVIVDDAGVRNLQEIEMYIDENDEASIIPAFFSTNEAFFSLRKNTIVEEQEANKMQTVTNLMDLEEVFFETGEAFKIKPTLSAEGIGPFGQIPTKRPVINETVLNEKISKIIDFKKYENLFESRPVLGKLYNNLSEMPYDLKTKGIDLLITNMSAVESDLSYELQHDLTKMLEILRGQ